MRVARGALVFGLAGLALWASTAAAQTPPTWGRLPYLSALRDFAAAYDASRERLVLFGGRAGWTALGDTWEWDGRHWSRITPPVSPSARRGHAMVYDASRQRVLLFGGEADGVVNDETWEWDGARWTQLFPAARPMPREGHGMVYDPHRQRVVLHGGKGSEPFPYIDTWEWDGVTWTDRTRAVFPPLRRGHAMAYDAVRRKTVLFGGCFRLFTPIPFDDTWEYDGATHTWVEVSTATRPPKTGDPVAAFDPVRQVVVMLGESSGTTWAWDGSAWTGQVPSPSPPRTGEGALVWHDARQTAVLLPGYRMSRCETPFESVPAETWEWDGASWSSTVLPSSPRDFGTGALAHDIARQRTILAAWSYASPPRPFGTWALDGPVWSELAPAQSPPGRIGFSMAYDRARERLVLFGGQDGLTSFDDTWEWDGATWAEAQPAQRPPGRGGMAMAYDQARGEVVMFGGWVPFGTFFADTWAFDGVSWRQLPGAPAPSGRQGHAMAYDEARQRVVLFGGWNSTSGNLNDTWERDGTRWQQVFPATQPPARTGHDLVYDAARGTVLMCGRTPGASAAVTWEWDGVDWSVLQPAGAGPAYSGAQLHLAHDRALGRTVAFDTSSVPSAQTWFLEVSPAGIRHFGAACAGTSGPPEISAFGHPSSPNPGFGIDVASARPLAPVVVFFSLGAAALPVGGGCTIYLDPAGLLTWVGTSSSSAGLASVPVQIPSGLLPVSFVAQAFVVDPNGPVLNVALTAGLEVSIRQ